ncbi:hypothetical protein AURDEDRAFT_148328 [Auricularia subglabra TFB-10046 SS5]|nr:hypothetical protein AURDEDRAFT_148328 [Auricularia subglabra TFB-10046 SS5]
MYTGAPYQLPYPTHYVASFPGPNYARAMPVVPGGDGGNGGGGGAPAPPVTVLTPAAPCALCCALVQSHRAITTHWEAQVNAFISWLSANGKSPAATALPEGCELVLRLTTTITYGRDCGIMEYAAVRAHNAASGAPAQYTFVSVALNVGSAAGFVDRCAFKNYNCPVHKLNFQLDLYRVKRG